MVEEAFDIGLNHPLRPPIGDDFRNPPQRIVRAALRAKAERAVAELGFPYRLQDLAEPILDQAVLEARHPERTIPPVPLGDVGAPHRHWLVAQSAYPCRQVRESRLHALSVVVFPDPIDSRRLASVLSPEALAQPLGVKQQPHQGSEPRVRLFARHPCETLKFGCHGQSPLGVGPCFALALSQTATPLLDPHYRVSTLVWMAPTSKHHRPCPCSYTCSRVPASSGPTLGSPWLPRILNVRLDTASDPGEYQRRSPSRSAGCCLPAGQNRRHSPTKPFGAQHLQGRLHPLPLHLACFRAYTSTRLLPDAPQGSILGSRRTITQAGLSPARTRDLARPHCPLFHRFFPPPNS